MFSVLIITMDECVVCGDKVIYACKPCKVSFCEEHKLLHEKNRDRVHIFEKVGIKLDSSQTARIVENLVLKITKVKVFEGKIIVETRALIQKIEKLCTKCLQMAKAKAQFYMSLLEKMQNL